MDEIVMEALGPARTMRFHSHDRADDHVQSFAVTVNADGLSATVGVTTGRGDGLPGFAASLAESFRGWDGDRTWRSMERDLELSATHHSGGHVLLVWTLNRLGRHGLPAGVPWSLSMTFTIDAGEPLKALASDLGAFFTSGLAAK